ncbi:uncharacterized protein LOC111003333 [Pieris rapae]|uniref:uncharacterized protein LOC111003333 n=1 Tax=Pieris rapae TaxID=64459 RepID=UPI001E27FA07|nr:uncharacterized protein LOC111003333 [Pieris rapae]
MVNVMKHPLPSHVSELGGGVRGGAGEGKVQYGRILNAPSTQESLKHSVQHVSVRRSRRRSRSSPVRLRSETNKDTENICGKSPLRRRSPSVSPSARQGAEDTQQDFWSPLSPPPPLVMPPPSTLAFTTTLSYFSSAPPCQPVSLVALPPTTREAACRSCSHEPSSRSKKKRSRSARRAARYVLRTLLKSQAFHSVDVSRSHVKLNDDVLDAEVGVESAKIQDKNEVSQNLEDEPLSDVDNCKKQSSDKEAKNVCARCSRCAGELNSTQLRLLLRHLRQLAHIDRLHRALRRAAR